MGERFSNLVSETRAETFETKQEERRRIEEAFQKEIVSVGKECGHKIEFSEPKMKVDPEKMPTDLNWSLFSEDISAEDKDDLRYVFNELKLFLNSPMFTDDFPDHVARRQWEFDNLEKISPEAKEYYNHNRLGVNFFSKLIGLGHILENYSLNNPEFINHEALATIESLIATLPREIKESEVFFLISSDRKIEAINTLSTHVSAVIRILGEKKADSLN